MPAVAQAMEEAEASLSLTDQDTSDAQERLSELLADVRSARRADRRGGIAGRIRSRRTVEDLARHHRRERGRKLRAAQRLSWKPRVRPSTLRLRSRTPRAGETRDDGARVIRVVPSGR